MFFLLEDVRICQSIAHDLNHFLNVRSIVAGWRGHPLNLAFEYCFIQFRQWLLPINGLVRWFTSLAEILHVRLATNSAQSSLMMSQYCLFITFIIIIYSFEWAEVFDVLWGLKVWYLLFQMTDHNLVLLNPIWLLYQLIDVMFVYCFLYIKNLRRSKSFGWRLLL